MASKKVELGDVLFFNDMYYQVVQEEVFYRLVNLSQGIITSDFDISIPGLLKDIKEYEIVTTAFIHYDESTMGEEEEE